MSGMNMAFWTGTVFATMDPGPLSPPQRFVQPTEAENPSTSNIIYPRPGGILAADPDGFPYLRQPLAPQRPRQVDPTSASPFVPAPTATSTPASRGFPVPAGRSAVQCPARRNLTKRSAPASNTSTPSNPSPKRQKSLPGHKFMPGGSGGGGHWIDTNGNVVPRASTARTAPQQSSGQEDLLVKHVVSNDGRMLDTNERINFELPTSSASPRHMRLVDVANHDSVGPETMSGLRSQSPTLHSTKDVNQVAYKQKIANPPPTLMAPANLASEQSSMAKSAPNRNTGVNLPDVPVTHRVPVSLLQTSTSLGNKPQHAPVLGNASSLLNTRALDRSMLQSPLTCSKMTLQPAAAQKEEPEKRSSGDGIGSTSLSTPVRITLASSESEWSLSEKSDAEFEKEYRQLTAEYTRNERSGSNSVTDVLKMMRYDSAHDARRRKAAKARELLDGSIPQPSGLFASIAGLNPPSVAPTVAPGQHAQALRQRLKEIGRLNDTIHSGPIAARNLPPPTRTTPIRSAPQQVEDAGLAEESDTVVSREESSEQASEDEDVDMSDDSESDNPPKGRSPTIWDERVRRLWAFTRGKGVRQASPRSNSASEDASSGSEDESPSPKKNKKKPRMTTPSSLVSSSAGIDSEDSSGENDREDGDSDRKDSDRDEELESDASSDASDGSEDEAPPSEKATDGNANTAKSSSSSSSSVRSGSENSRDDGSHESGSSEEEASGDEEEGSVIVVGGNYDASDEGDGSSDEGDGSSDEEDHSAPPPAYPAATPKKVQRIADLINGVPDKARKHGLRPRKFFENNKDALSDVFERHGLVLRKHSIIAPFIGDCRLFSQRVWSYLTCTGLWRPAGQGSYETAYKDLMRKKGYGNVDMSLGIVRPAPLTSGPTLRSASAALSASSAAPARKPVTTPKSRTTTATPSGSVGTFLGRSGLRSTAKKSNPQ